MSKPLFVFLVSACLSVVAHVWLIGAVKAMQDTVAEMDLLNPTLSALGPLVNRAIEVQGAIAAVVATVIVCMTTCYFALKKALDSLESSGGDDDVIRLFPDFVLIFIPVYGLIAPLSRYRTTERWLLSDHLTESGGPGLPRRLLMPVLVVVFQLYLVLGGLLSFRPNSVGDQEALEVDGAMRPMLIALTVVAVVSAALAGGYLIVVERNVRRLLRHGRNRITAVFE